MKYSEIKNIILMLKNHDWTYDYSDDMKYWSNGYCEQLDIFKELDKLPISLANKLWTKYCLPEHDSLYINRQREE